VFARLTQFYRMLSQNMICRFAVKALTYCYSYIYNAIAKMKVLLISHQIQRYFA